MKRTKKRITYHKRIGYPIMHNTKTGRKYVMVRKKSSGVKRLYEGSKYSVDGKVKVLKL